MQGLLNDPQTADIVGELLGQFYNQLQMMLAPPPMPGGPGEPPPPGGPEPGHTPGAGQAMAQSNANSTKPQIANKGQTTAPVGG